MVVSVGVLAIEIMELVFDLEGLIALILAVVKFLLRCWQRFMQSQGEPGDAPEALVPSDWMLAMCA
jgi:hypothetical protein